MRKIELDRYVIGAVLNEGRGPCLDAAEIGSHVTVADYQPSGTGPNMIVVFETPSDGSAAAVDATVRVDSGETTVKIPVVVGRQLGTPANWTHKTYGRLTRP